MPDRWAPGPRDRRSPLHVRMRGRSGGDPSSRPVTSTDGAARVRQVLRLTPGRGTRLRDSAGISPDFPWTSNEWIQLCGRIRPRSPGRCQSTRSAGRSGRCYSGLQAHRPVGDAVVLEQADLLDAAVEQLLPGLADPRLGVGLGRELLRALGLSRRRRSLRCLVPPGPASSSSVLRGLRGLGGAAASDARGWQAQAAQLQRAQHGVEGDALAVGPSRGTAPSPAGSA